ncbi:uncharacterized protein LOC112494000 isoform X2 [Cephus cinctus]|uniref:Uncharacterized protein LOC112494000 isoform X2 n=1 Tax=Cephus cinctus TaxID=211228 RepID=A0AAJ7RCR2_CEPCN|nr:uncharacterized protein LOC112494000 isoform X2 [Cephus cinctus]
MFMYRRKRRLRTVCCVHSAFQRQHVGVFCDTAPLVYSQSFELQHSIANGFFSSFTEGLKVTRKGREWKKNRINSAKPLRDNMLHRLVWGIYCSFEAGCLRLWFCLMRNAYSRDVTSSAERIS